MLVDTHAHLNFFAFDKDRNILIEKCLKNNIWMINVGSKYETSKRAVEIAEKYKEGVYAAIGLHPIHLATGLMKIKTDPEEGDFLAKGEDFDEEKYKKLALSGVEGKKVVAIGEIGLDYYWRPKTSRKKELFKQKQRDLLLKQLNLARKFNLPVIFHCRMAHQDLIKFLLEHPEIRPQVAVAHGFVGNLKELQKYLDFGFYIGFNGIIFKEIEGINFRENIRKTPLQRILIETDCPYLAPPAFPEERNSPLATKYILKEISEIKKISQENLEKITTENAKKLFNI